MNILLIFFALPIATIIISIALQKILKCPPLVAAILFAIFLIVTFIVNNLNFLIATIIYTIISFITAVIVCFICRFIRRCFRDNEDENTCCDFCRRRERRNSDRRSNNSNINCNCNDNCDCDNNSNSSCNTNENGVTARINVIPNTNGNNGRICGCFRRR